MRRSLELDALRGFAALVVVMFHLWLTLPKEWHDTGPPGTLNIAGLLRYTPLHLFISGPGCVALFFVLSGFVLAAALSRTQNIDYRAFLIRRICRIYLPFAAVICGAAIANTLLAFPSTANVDPWLWRDQWSEQPSIALFLQHLLMIGSVKTESLVPPMWSLVIEMRISILFPLLYLAVTGQRFITILTTTAVYVAASYFMTRSGQTGPQDLLQSIAFTVEYLPLFILGILLSNDRLAIAAVYKAMPAVLRWPIGIAGLLCLGAPSFGPSTTIEMGKKALWLVAVGVGSSTTIVYVINNPIVARMLAQKPFLFLGQISYSLYLTHMVVIFVMIKSWQDILTVPQILLMTIPTCFLVAALCHHFIEAPANRLGHRLVNAAIKWPKTVSTGLS